jgi:hypothetical protein
MRRLWRWTAAAVGLLSVTLYAGQAFAAQVEPTVARNVAMVHGAGPNNSSWAVAAPLGYMRSGSTRKWRDPRVSSDDDMYGAADELSLRRQP